MEGLGRDTKAYKGREAAAVHIWEGAGSARDRGRSLYMGSGGALCPFMGMAAKAPCHMGGGGGGVACQPHIWAGEG